MLNKTQVMKKLARTKNKKIKIMITNENATDEDGYPIESEKTIKPVYANVKSLRGKEFYQASQVNAQDDKIFYINYFPGLSAKAQIEYKNEIYEIIAPPINIDEANMEYEIRTRLVKASG
ncbi:head-tail adaptor protein [Clostridium botulinum]|uniref:phage head closure protein n=1 Tax=Clostridium botulinum TaxID=1491 RepID=UPI0007746789|nr:phage head closure protein [Clostridium botulinum]AUN19048.1 head-tail adaptor protein [Clostridium botulinum]AUN23166.1 head-tail adaptor protein [Clostridium botulinum]MBN3421900.1 head-tail adaptor protein [Clostridium botulinum]OSA86426.1 head-tail adaptor protein [Clostridium botulinum]